jgi:hypothetical protein
MRISGKLKGLRIGNGILLVHLRDCYCRHNLVYLDQSIVDVSLMLNQLFISYLFQLGVLPWTIYYIVYLARSSYHFHSLIKHNNRLSYLDSGIWLASCRWSSKCSSNGYLDHPDTLKDKFYSAQNIDSSKS